MYGVDRKYLLNKDGTERYILAAEREALLAFSFQDDNPDSVRYSSACVVRMLDDAKEKGADISRYEDRLKLYEEIFTKAIRKYIYIAIQFHKINPKDLTYSPDEIKMCVKKAVDSGIDVSDFEEQIKEVEINYSLVNIEQKITELKDTSKYYYTCDFKKFAETIAKLIVTAIELNMNDEQANRLEKLSCDFINVCVIRDTKK